MNCGCHRSNHPGDLPQFPREMTHEMTGDLGNSRSKLQGLLELLPETHSYDIKPPWFCLSLGAYKVSGPCSSVDTDVLLSLNPCMLYASRSFV